MRYLSIFMAPERPEPPSEEEMTRMGALIEEFAKSGQLISTEGCLPSALGFKVRRSGDKVTVKDGPFTEAREVVGGFAILEVASREEAIDLTKRFMDVAGDGECEIRQLYQDPAT